MSKYFEKTHEEVEFEQTICAKCGGVWFWSYNQVQSHAYHDGEDYAVINCPYCCAEYHYCI